MALKIEPSERGRGRVEYLANKEIIDDFLAKGHTKISIYHALSKANKITIKYQTFLMYLRKAEIRRNEGES